MMDVSRHKSADMLRADIRDGELFQDCSRIMQARDFNRSVPPTLGISSAGTKTVDSKNGLYIWRNQRKVPLLRPCSSLSGVLNKESRNARTNCD
jgi:hypothetical protein